MQYRRAVEIEEVAQELIEDHHSMLRNHGPKIVYVMTKTPNNLDAGKDYRIRKVTGVNAFLAQSHNDRLPTEFGWDGGELAAIEIKEQFWQRLKDAQREGLVDHLLSHLTPDIEKDTWIVEPPEFGEFPEVLERHGFWKPGHRMRDFAAVVSEQLSLLDDDTEEADEETEDGSLEDSIEALRPDPESGIESVTISHGEKSVTLTGDRA